MDQSNRGAGPQIDLTWNLLMSQKASAVVYTTPFYNSKISIPNLLASSFRETTSVRGKSRPTYKSKASEAPTGPSSIRSDNGDYKDPLRSNKPRPPNVPTGPYEGFIRPRQAPPLSSTHEDLGANRYSQQELDRIIQTFLQALKGGSSFRDKLKAKSLDIYCGSSHIKCYNFYQRYDYYFTIAEATGPNPIPFTASFLRDQINFYW